MIPAGAVFAVTLLVSANVKPETISEPVPAPERVLIDDVLGGRPRPFIRYPHTVSFGPTGRRLWVNYLDERPGFVGRIDFIHRINIPFLFLLTVERDGEDLAWESVEHSWYPSHLVMEFRSGPVILRERKFVAWDDVAVDVVEVMNNGSEAISLKCSIPGDFTRAVEAIARDRLGRSLALWFRSVAPGVDGGESLEGPKFRVDPESSMQVIAAAAVGLEGEADIAERLAGWLDEENPLARQKDEYQKWFDGAPVFVSDDPWMNRMWAYRWYLVRRNLADPGAGNLPHPFYLEGRGHKMSNEPYDPRGWEFSKLIPFSSPFHLLEGRWHRDLSPCEGEIDDLVLNQSEEGLFQYATVNRHGSYYANFVPWAVSELSAVRPEARVGEARLEALKRNVRAWFRLFDPDGDSLPHVTDHNRTGKEYQPSYFYFDGFPKDAKGATKALLERVDVAAYQYMNAVGVSRLCRRAGDTEGEREFAGLAENIRTSVLAEMWDPETRFFYDIRESDGAKALVKNVVGFDPFMAGIASEEHLAAFDHLWDPEEFWTPWPVPSVSIDCPAFAPDASWFGDHIKGPHGAVWNGPTWPFTDSTVLMALANATRTAGHRFDSRWAELLRRYTRLQFRNRDIDLPMVVEHHNPLTGEEISQEEDYFHSSWIDLVVTGVGGIVPSEDAILRLDPIDCGLGFFHLRGVPFRGREVDISWLDPGRFEGTPDLPSGFIVRVDGRLVADRERLEPVEIDLR